ncbi:MAG TPA: hypothetical protein VGK57_00050, partial [Candidatus Binatia bacterium]
PKESHWLCSARLLFLMRKRPTFHGSGMPWEINARLLNPLVFDTDPLKIGRRSCPCHTKVRCYESQTEADQQADHGFHDKAC